MVDNKQMDLLNRAVGTTSGTLEVQDPLSLDPASKVRMTPQQWLSTFDPNFKRTYPAYAALNAYHHPFDDRVNPFYNAGQGLRKMFDKGYPGVSNILDKGPLVGGLASAVPGVALGALSTLLLNYLRGDSLTSGIGRNSLLGALATAPIGAYSGYIRKYKPFAVAPEITKAHTPYSMGDLARERMAERAAVQSILGAQTNKYASTKKAFGSSAEIIAAINSSPGLSFAEKSQLTAGVAKLSQADQNQLADLITQMSGAAVGAFIAKYLLNKGVVGSVLGAIFGGVVAKAIFGSQSSSPVKNFMGQPVLNLPAQTQLPISTSGIYSSISL